MQKIWILFFFTFIIVGCSKTNNQENNINTLIEEDKNILIGINYPITGFNTLDRLIESEVEKIYNDFKEEYESFSTLNEKSELNIDYTYELINENYINICINVFINSSVLDNPNNYMITYIYDISQKKIITLKDIIKEEQLEEFTSLVTSKIISKYNTCVLLDNLKKEINAEYKSYPLFNFDDENIYIYFNPNIVTASYCDIVYISIPLSSFDLKIVLKKENKIVSKEELITKVKVLDPNKKVIALTFDDGPSNYTSKIIDYLNEQESVATFFVLGNKVAIYDKTMKKMIAYGNEIGNHSYNHKWLTKVKEEELLLQIDKTQSIIYEMTNYKPITFRPTYGSLNKKMKENINLDIVLWNIDTMDWKYKSVDKIVTRATKNVKDGDIILMHDTYERTYKAILKIVPILKEKGFQLVTVSELKEINFLRNQLKPEAS